MNKSHRENHRQSPRLAREFEDLLIWQTARALANDIYSAFTDCRDYGFKDQVQRAAVSIMNNIAEGFERETRPDFKRFLGMAKASAGEVRSMLYLADDLTYLTPPHAEKLRLSVKQLSRSIKAFSKSLT